MQETRVQSLGWEDPLGKGMATHSSILAWRIPWTEGPGRLQSVGSQRVGHNWATSTPTKKWMVGLTSFYFKSQGKGGFKVGALGTSGAHLGWCGVLASSWRSQGSFGQRAGQASELQFLCSLRLRGIIRLLASGSSKGRLRSRLVKAASVHYTLTTASLGLLVLQLPWWLRW